MLIFATVDASCITFSVSYFTLHGTVAPSTPSNENNLNLGYINYLLLKLFFGRFIQTYIEI
ncbi:hypothetical protein bcgnr5411_32630 [Bacillus cereus]